MGGDDSETSELESRVHVLGNESVPANTCGEHLDERGLGEARFQWRSEDGTNYDTHVGTVNLRRLISFREIDWMPNRGHIREAQSPTQLQVSFKSTGTGNLPFQLVSKEWRSSAKIVVVLDDHCISH